MTVAVIGDIHGQADQLRTLLNKIRNLDKDTRVYHAGDLVDRGSKSREVLDICVQKDIHGVLGNHELWLLHVLQGKDLPNGVISRIMGGLATLESYGVSREWPIVKGTDHAVGLRQNMPPEHKAYLQALPSFREFEVAGQKYLLVHTGIRSNSLAGVNRVPDSSRLSEMHKVQVILQAEPDGFFWVGPQPEHPETVGRLKGYIQIFGHTPRSKVIEAEHYIALDTGCGTCPPSKLSAIFLRDDGSRTVLTA